MKYALMFAIGWEIYQIGISLKGNLSSAPKVLLFMLVSTKQILAIGLMFYSIDQALHQLLPGG